MSAPTPIPVPKGFQRLGAFPLDPTSVFGSLADLTTYAASGTAYQGQICAVAETTGTRIFEIGTAGSLIELAPIASPIFTGKVEVEELTVFRGGEQLRFKSNGEIESDWGTNISFEQSQVTTNIEGTPSLAFHWRDGVFGVGGRPIKDVGAPTEDNDAVRVTDLQSEAQARLDADEALQAQVTAKSPLTLFFALSGATQEGFNTTYRFTGNFIAGRPEYLSAGDERLYFNESTERWELAFASGDLGYFHLGTAHDPLLLSSGWRRMAGAIQSTPHSLTLTAVQPVPNVHGNAGNPVARAAIELRMEESYGDLALKYAVENDSWQIHDPDNFRSGLGAAPIENPTFEGTASVTDGGDFLTLSAARIQSTFQEGLLDFEETRLAGSGGNVLNWQSPGQLSVENRTLKNLGAPASANDAVRKTDLDGKVSRLARTFPASTNANFSLTGAAITGGHADITFTSYNFSAARLFILPRITDGAKDGDRVILTHNASGHVGGPWPLIVCTYEIIAPMGSPIYGTNLVTLATLAGGQSATFDCSPNGNILNWRVRNVDAHTHALTFLTARHTGNGTTTSYAAPGTLTSADTAASLLVTIQGVVQEPTADYSINIAQNSVILTTPLPSGNKMVIFRPALA